MIDRMVYKLFFWVSGFSYFLIAFFTYIDRPPLELWPGDTIWAVGYLIAGICTTFAGFFISKSDQGPKMFIRKFGLYATPALLVARAAANVFSSGIDGVLGAVFLVWGAFVVIWAAHLLRHLPADADEWDFLEDEFKDLKERVAELDQE